MPCTFVRQKYQKRGGLRFPPHPFKTPLSLKNERVGLNKTADRKLHFFQSLSHCVTVPFTQGSLVQYFVYGSLSSSSRG